MLSSPFGITEAGRAVVSAVRGGVDARVDAGAFAASRVPRHECCEKRTPHRAPRGLPTPRPIHKEHIIDRFLHPVQFRD